MTAKQKNEASLNATNPEGAMPEEAMIDEKVAHEEVEEHAHDVKADGAKHEVCAELDADCATDEVTIESLTAQIAALKTQATDSMDKAVRAQAELDNVRKRSNRDIENAHKYALDKFISELLPVLDSMELGIHAANNSAGEGEVADISSLHEGMDLTMKMLSSSLEKSGVNPITPKEGDKFNPEQHEAMTMQEMESTESGTVISTLQKGYTLNGRLVRPAMVIVAK